MITEQLHFIFKASLWDYEWLGMCIVYLMAVFGFKVFPSLQALPDLEKEVDEQRSHYEFSVSIREKKKKLQDLRHELAWANVSRRFYSYHSSATNFPEYQSTAVVQFSFLSS